MIACERSLIIWWLQRKVDRVTANHSLSSTGNLFTPWPKFEEKEWIGNCLVTKDWSVNYSSFLISWIVGLVIIFW